MSKLGVMQGCWNGLQTSSYEIKELKSPRLPSLILFPFKLVINLSQLTSNPLNPIIRKRSELNVSPFLVILYEIINKNSVSEI